MTDDRKRKTGGEVERLATWLEANSSGVYRDCRTAADLLREQERALADSREECERLRNELAIKEGLLESGLETIRFRGEFLAALANEMRAEGVVLEQEPMRVVNQHKARAERLAGAGKRVTAAFRALGCKLGFTELVETRHECEAAILALDAALEQEPQE